jgi:hypothetical protein
MIACKFGFVNIVDLFMKKKLSIPANAIYVATQFRHYDIVSKLSNYIDTKELPEAYLNEIKSVAMKNDKVDIILNLLRIPDEEKKYLLKKIRC